MSKLEASLALIFLVGVSILAAFGIDHADESLLIAVVSPLILVVSIALGVMVVVAVRAVAGVCSGRDVTRR